MYLGQSDTDTRWKSFVCDKMLNDPTVSSGQYIRYGCDREGIPGSSGREWLPFAIGGVIAFVVVAAIVSGRK